MDWCDKDAPEGALDDLFELIRDTPMLEWLLLTKRANRIVQSLPNDWGPDGYENVRLGVTVEDTDACIKVDFLRDIPAKIHFISAEPLLGDISGMDLTNIDWTIIGGESGPNSRYMEPYWALKLAICCEAEGTAVWFKQHGGNTKDKGGCLLNGRERKNWPK